MVKEMQIAAAQPSGGHVGGHVRIGLEVERLVEIRAALVSLGGRVGEVMVQGRRIESGRHFAHHLRIHGVVPLRIEIRRQLQRRQLGGAKQRIERAIGDPRGLGERHGVEKRAAGDDLVLPCDEVVVIAVAQAQGGQGGVGQIAATRAVERVAEQPMRVVGQVAEGAVMREAAGKSGRIPARRQQRRHFRVTGAIPALVEIPVGRMAPPRADRLVMRKRIGRLRHDRATQIGGRIPGRVELLPRAELIRRRCRGCFSHASGPCASCHGTDQNPPANATIPCGIMTASSGPGTNAAPGYSPSHAVTAHADWCRAPPRPGPRHRR